jgi:hypothetical protein
MASVGERILNHGRPVPIESPRRNGGARPEEVERFFLRRLERFARLAAQTDELPIPQWRRLARHATLSTYRDCEALGLRQEAKNILGKASGLNSQ